MENLIIPQYYKDIRIAEIEFKIKYLENNTITVLGKNFNPQNVSVKDIYIYKISTKYKNKNYDKWEKWKPLLREKQTWDKSFIYPIKLLDGHTKTIHYLILNHSLETREKSAHYRAETTKFCKRCSDNNLEKIETEAHILIFCEPALELWQFIRNWLKSLKLELIISTENQILGFEKNIISNFITCLAQRSLWLTRKAYETNKQRENIIAFFKRNMYRMINRQKAVMIKTEFWNTFGKLVYSDKNNRLLHFHQH